MLRSASDFGIYAQDWKAAKEQARTAMIEHFFRCPASGGWIDCRDLAQVFENEGPLPHPAQNRPQ
jgi:hypothetical protein